MAASTEISLLDLDRRLVVVEERLNHVATKEDVQKIETILERKFNYLLTAISIGLIAMLIRSFWT